MQFLDHAKIRTKIVAVIALMGALAIAGLVFVSMQFKNADAKYSYFISHESTAATLNARATGGLLQMGLQLGLMLVNDPSSIEFAAAVKKYEGDLKLMKERVAMTAELVPSRAAAVEAVNKAVDDFDQLGRKVIALSREGKGPEAQAAMREAGAEVMKVLPLFAGGNDELMKSVDVGTAELQEATDRTILTGLATLGLSIIALIVLGLYVASRGITGPIARLSDRMTSLADGETDDEIIGVHRRDEIGAMAKAVQVFKDNALKTQALELEAEVQRNLSEDQRRRNAEQERVRAEAMAEATSALATGLKHLSVGDLTFTLERPFAADFESLRADFNAAVEQLRGTLGSVAQATNSIDSGSREISQSADDLSKRTEQQAASLEETAAALDQITTNVANSTKRAEEARTVAIQANDSARKSGAVVANAVDAMGRIEQSSGQISSIIGVIDDIAFQTNLLALNAGVEAARAGEAGKGFAVVAQEVRELAQRSATAAKEIKDLIGKSSVEVETGVKLVSATGDALKTIERYIVTINEHMDSIATSAREQSVGLQEVNTAVNQMDQVTQQNAAMVEEANAAGATLATEAVRLREIVGQFQLGGASAYTPSVQTAALRQSASVRDR
ncbi:methyl-accepting chemotaxis protein [Pseudorhizobium tarimense]|uniref:Methyl-accepting chemotaxis protein n=1 Tax=Pseudorhizobium tarimense TaxID=1079109 RepID=A0ABV2HCU6_9HYPH|nr:HAMP domain-containing methyl-accepting chemotaxis protein [Pseudorhizobium tarimense]MCJ8521412.1 methyl-accepting chemotaxis protein [Pseudorhizobium tarimense]